jgi:hypothetical protein
LESKLVAESSEKNPFHHGWGVCKILGFRI